MLTIVGFHEEGFRIYNSNDPAGTTPNSDWVIKVARNPLYDGGTNPPKLILQNLNLVHPSNGAVLDLTNAGTDKTVQLLLVGDNTLDGGNEPGLKVETSNVFVDNYGATSSSLTVLGTAGELTLGGNFTNNTTITFGAENNAGSGIACPSWIIGTCHDPTLNFFIVNNGTAINNGDLTSYSSISNTGLIKNGTSGVMHANGAVYVAGGGAGDWGTTWFTGNGRFVNYNDAAGAFDNLPTGVGAIYGRVNIDFADAPFESFAAAYLVNNGGGGSIPKITLGGYVQQFHLFNSSTSAIEQNYDVEVSSGDAPFFGTPNIYRGGPILLDNVKLKSFDVSQLASPATQSTQVLINGNVTVGELTVGTTQLDLKPFADAVADTFTVSAGSTTFGINSTPHNIGDGTNPFTVVLNDSVHIANGAELQVQENVTLVNNYVIENDGTLKSDAWIDIDGTTGDGLFYNTTNGSALPLTTPAPSSAGIGGVINVDLSRDFVAFASGYNIVSDKIQPGYHVDGFRFYGTPTTTPYTIEIKNTPFGSIPGPTGSYKGQPIRLKDVAGTSLDVSDAKNIDGNPTVHLVLESSSTIENLTVNNAKLLIDTVVGVTSTAILTVNGSAITINDTLTNNAICISYAEITTAATGVVINKGNLTAKANITNNGKIFNDGYLTNIAILDIDGSGNGELVNRNSVAGPSGAPAVGYYYNGIDVLGSATGRNTGVINIDLARNDLETVVFGYKVDRTVNPPVLTIAAYHSPDGFRLFSSAANKQSIYTVKIAAVPTHFGDWNNYYQEEPIILDNVHIKDFDISGVALLPNGTPRVPLTINGTVTLGGSGGASAGLTVNNTDLEISSKRNTGTPFDTLILEGSNKILLAGSTTVNDYVYIVVKDSVINRGTFTIGSASANSALKVDVAGYFGNFNSIDNNSTVENLGTIFDSTGVFTGNGVWAPGTTSAQYVIPYAHIPKAISYYGMYIKDIEFTGFDDSTIPITTTITSAGDVNAPIAGQWVWNNQGATFADAVGNVTANFPTIANGRKFGLHFVPDNGTLYQTVIERDTIQVPIGPPQPVVIDLTNDDITNSGNSYGLAVTVTDGTGGLPTTLQLNYPVGKYIIKNNESSNTTGAGTDFAIFVKDFAPEKILSAGNPNRVDSVVLDIVLEGAIIDLSTNAYTGAALDLSNADVVNLKLVGDNSITGSQDAPAMQIKGAKLTIVDSIAGGLTGSLTLNGAADEIKVDSSLVNKGTLIVSGAQTVKVGEKATFTNKGSLTVGTNVKVINDGVIVNDSIIINNGFVQIDGENGNGLFVNTAQTLNLLSPFAGGKGLASTSTPSGRIEGVINIDLTRNDLGTFISGYTVDGNVITIAATQHEGGTAHGAYRLIGDGTPNNKYVVKVAEVTGIDYVFGEATPKNNFCNDTIILRNVNLTPTSGVALDLSETPDCGGTGVGKVYIRLEGTSTLTGAGAPGLQVGKAQLEVLGTGTLTVNGAGTLNVDSTFINKADITTTAGNFTIAVGEKATFTNKGSLTVDIDVKVINDGVIVNDSILVNNGTVQIDGENGNGLFVNTAQTLDFTDLSLGGKGLAGTGTIKGVININLTRNDFGTFIAGYKVLDDTITIAATQHEGGTAHGAYRLIGDGTFSSKKYVVKVAEVTDIPYVFAGTGSTNKFCNDTIILHNVNLAPASGAVALDLSATPACSDNGGGRVYIRLEGDNTLTGSGAAGLQIGGAKLEVLGTGSLTVNGAGTIVVDSTFINNTTNTTVGITVGANQTVTIGSEATFTNKGLLINSSDIYNEGLIINDVTGTFNNTAVLYIAGTAGRGLFVNRSTTSGGYIFGGIDVSGGGTVNGVTNIDLGRTDYETFVGGTYTVDATSKIINLGNHTEGFRLYSSAADNSSNYAVKIADEPLLNPVGGLGNQWFTNQPIYLDNVHIADFDISGVAVTLDPTSTVPLIIDGKVTLDAFKVDNTLFTVDAANTANDTLILDGTTVVNKTATIGVTGNVGTLIVNNKVVIEQPAGNVTNNWNLTVNGRIQNNGNLVTNAPSGYIATGGVVFDSTGNIGGSGVWATSPATQHKVTPRVVVPLHDYVGNVTPVGGVDSLVGFYGETLATVRIPLVVVGASINGTIVPIAGRWAWRDSAAILTPVTIQSATTNYGPDSGASYAATFYPDNASLYDTVNRDIRVVVLKNTPKFSLVTQGWGKYQSFPQTAPCTDTIWVSVDSVDLQAIPLYAKIYYDIATRHNVSKPVSGDDLTLIDSLTTDATSATVQIAGIDRNIVKFAFEGSKLDSLKVDTFDIYIWADGTVNTLAIAEGAAKGIDTAFLLKKADLGIVPDSGQQKLYDDPEPAEFTFTLVTADLRETWSEPSLADTLNHLGIGSTLLGRATAAVGDSTNGHENAGVRAYTLGNLTFDNYEPYLAHYVDISGAPYSSPTRADSFHIVPRPVSISNLLVADKVYDGTDSATLSLSQSPIIVGNVDGGYLGFKVGAVLFADSAVGNNKPITFRGFELIADSMKGFTPDYYADILKNYVLVDTLVDTIKANITKKLLTVTPTAGQEKIYGYADPVLDYTVSGLVGADTLPGGGNLVFNPLTDTLARVAGEDVGDYNIVLGSLSADNYDVVLSTPPVTFAITPREVTIGGLTVQPQKTYDGTTTIQPGNVVFDNAVIVDALTADTAGGLGSGLYIKRADYSAHYDTKDVGTGKDVIFSGFALDGAKAGNYLLTAQPATVTANITKAPLTITPNTAQRKVYGQPDPVITFAAATYCGSDNAGNSLTGALSRDSSAIGDNVGTYAIRIGTLDADNYAITLASGLFEITKAPITVAPNVGQTKVYGESDQPFTFIAAPLLLGDNQADAFTGALSRDSSASGDSVGTYAFRIGTLAAANYEITTFIPGNYAITKASQSINFAFPAGYKVYHGDTTLVATTTSPTAPSLPVKFRLRPTDAVYAALSNDTLQPLQSGTIEITAYVEPNANYFDAAEVTTTVVLTHNNTNVNSISVSNTVENPAGTYTVADRSTHLTVTVVTEDVGATVMYNGVAGNSFLVNVTRAGAHTITFDVLASDGITVLPYEITIIQLLYFDDYVAAKWNDALLFDIKRLFNDLKLDPMVVINCNWYRDSVLVGTGLSWSDETDGYPLLGHTYYFEVLFTDGTVIHSTLKDMTITTGITAVAAGKAKVYPNPAVVGQTLHIVTAEGNSLAGKTAEVYSISGTLVHKQVLSDDAAITLHLSAGVYIIKVDNNVGKVVLY
ncbi:hypothetical protein AGMMS4956_12380 [Bacteroidia bacterium]|nr:hypothetical protein AGMMS4956_12380 [Bacteroidia bacterium]